jgi:tRNA U54 and U55 pseudouridine synthase Pus10
MTKQQRAFTIKSPEYKNRVVEFATALIVLEQEDSVDSVQITYTDKQFSEDVDLLYATLQSDEYKNFEDNDNCSTCSDDTDKDEDEDDDMQDIEFQLMTVSALAKLIEMTTAQQKELGTHSEALKQLLRGKL